MDREVAIMNLGTWLSIQGSSWYQESWDKTLGKPFSTTLTLQDSKNALWEYFQLFLADCTCNNNFACWCASFGNIFLNIMECAKPKHLTKDMKHATHKKVLMDWSTFIETFSFSGTVVLAKFIWCFIVQLPSTARNNM